MEKDPNKLYLIIAWLLLLGLILGLIFVHSFVSDLNLKSILNSIFSNLVSTLLAVIALYYFLKKKFLKDEENLDHRSQSEISKLEGIIKEQTDEIDNILLSIHDGVEKILSRKTASSWEDYYNILAKLRGEWLEFIPQREADSCEISIATFNLDNHDKHEFAGTNFFTNTGKANYQWKTEKVLPPIRHDDNTIYIYYIYRRYNNREFQGMYGFGKLVAKRNAGDPDSYSFVSGFFFNEATPRNGHHAMKLIQLKTVEQFLGIEIKMNQENEQFLKETFKTLKESNIYEKWRQID